MNPQQRVFRIRRKYNRWVANETLEDYALRFTAKSARRWSLARVSNTALEAIGGAITLSYGFSNTVAAVIAVGIIIFLTGIPICYHAARRGVDIDLLTRGAGFGYIGSTITSLIYASFTFIFFALEAAIMALALELWLLHKRGCCHTASYPRHHSYQSFSGLDSATVGDTAGLATHMYRFSV